ncbi:MAG: putative Ig domain-containing protein [Bryobacteraceae bacterium]
MRLALLALISLAAAAQTAPLTLATYDMFRYAVAGRTFSYRFAPGGGVAPYTFSVEEGSALPPGLRLNASTGELSGTVPQVGEFRHIVCVSDATQGQICVPFLVIAVANEGDTYTELPPARVTTEYQNLVAKPGEFAEFSYDPVSGSLPPGMVLEVTGRLYGIPRAPGGAWAFRLRARELDGTTVVKPYFIRVLGPLAATTVMPNGFSATEYAGQLTVLGDMPPHVWTVRRGPLPPGYVFSESGRIGGICNQPGRYAFALRVADPSGSSHDREMVLTVEGTLPPIQVLTTSLPGAAVGVEYRQQLNISGGRAPYSFRVLGTLPPGITLAATGVLIGTPAAAGSYVFTLQVTDISGAATSKTLTIVVGNLRYTGPAALELFASEEARVALAAEGGQAPYRWTVVSGALPGGITLTEAGVLSGTAVAASTATVTLRLTDATARTLEFPLAITVGAPRPVLSSNGVVNGASFAGGGISPGEIVTLFGTRMGPGTIAPFILDGNGRVPVALAGTRVLFGGQAAPLLYVSAGQIGAIVPYSVAGRTTVDVVVDANGVRSAALNVPLAASAPGLFTVDASGKGQAAAFNQDGTLNGRAAPVRAGDVVVLFGTGEGQTLPAGQDGVLTGPETPRPALPVRVTIGGREGVVLYAGGAPGLVAGLVQVNVRVPADVVAGDAVPVVLRVGEAIGAPGATLAVQ